MQQQSIFGSSQASPNYEVVCWAGFHLYALTVMWSETVGLRTKPVRDQKDRKEFDLVYTTGTDDGLLKVYGKIHTGA